MLWMDGWTDGCMGVCYGQIDVMNGWTDEWMDICYG